MRPYFTHQPSAWLRTPRYQSEPVKYAAAIEVWRRSWVERLVAWFWGRS